MPGAFKAAKVGDNIYRVCTDCGRPKDDFSPQEQALWQ